jgi:hypothetical protein
MLLTTRETGSRTVTQEEAHASHEEEESHTQRVSQRNVKDMEVITVSRNSIRNYLTEAELPLPLFDEATTNPVAHMKHLDSYFKLKGVPDDIKVNIAIRSLRGDMSKEWAETKIDQVMDYANFKPEFLNTWWSSKQQKKIRCNLYQGRYGNQSGLSLSSYFLKHATLATYLDPRPIDIEIIEALQTHYSYEIQRTLLSMNTNTISETADMLWKLEFIEAQEQYSKSLNQNVNFTREDRRNEHTRNVEVKNQDSRPVSKTYRQPTLGRNNYYGSR